MASETRVDDFEATMAQVKVLQNTVDPQTRPFDSKYQAVALLRKLESTLSDQLNTAGPNEHMLLKKQLRTVHYTAGVLNYETEENAHAVKQLKAFMELVDPKSEDYMDLENVLMIIEANNHLCKVYFQREEYEQAEAVLIEAETLYEAYKSLNASQESKSLAELEESYMVTMLFFSQVYERLENSNKSAIYIQRTMRATIASGQFDPVQIATFCLQMASYYQSEERWYQALYVINVAETLLKPNANERSEGEIALFRAKFYAEYLDSQYQKHGYLPSITEEVEEFQGITLDEACPRPSLAPLVTSSAVDAWVAKCEQYFENALAYFVLEGFTTEHVTIAIERDSMWNTASEIPGDGASGELRKRKKALLRLRLSHLEPLVNALSPNHFFNLVQQLLFTCGEIYESIVGLSDLPLTDGITLPDNTIANYEQKEKKLNKALVTGVHYYQKFLDTILSPEGKLPKALDPGHEESFFRAHLSLALLHTKFRSRSNRRVTLMMLRKAASYYKLTDTLARAYKPTTLIRELELCKELHQLMSMKADAIEASLSGPAQ